MYYEFIWLALVIIFAVIEALTAGLTVIWFAIGCAGAAVCAACSGPLWLQVVIFIIISLICLLLVRPIAKSRLKNRAEPTNADRVIGMEALVTEDIDNISGKGAVIIDGITWSARSRSGEPVAKGSKVKVIRIEGVRVFVEKVQ